ncbi:uncharacterized protein LOC119605586 [Lucilia sericata]|uniref:uncharacterized protein LOC119605586 n=1 Tax=Lucilia sericata TaxID=13632 RepID=UPI0018A82502|nr:uncharacterized protein LOC119605586 [Lucilia sericata]
METFEKILHNCDALESIFKYLDLNEQLKISQICKEFEFPITQLIWRLKCRNIKFTQIFPETIMVKCNNKDKECAMDYERIEMFLSLCRSYVQNFELNFMEFAIERITFDFKNLTTITFYKCQVNNEHLKQLARNCLKLSRFHMECCKNCEQKPLIMGRDIQVNIFEEMPELSELTVINFYNIDMDYKILQKFYKISKLKKLSIKAPLYVDTSGSNCQGKIMYKTKSLDSLRIERFCDQKLWLQFNLKCLVNFKNLTKLTLKMDPFADITVDDIFFLTLANNCQLLEDLTLEQCKLIITKFSPIENLSSLTLNWCRELSGCNLREIFSVYKLQSLKLTNTLCQKNIYNYNYTGDNLKALTVGTTLQPDITSALTNPSNRFENISKLIWFQSGPSSLGNPIILENIPYIYPKVQKLLIIDYFIKIEDLKCLKYLNFLKIHLNTIMSWFYLKHLLQLPHLTNLIIGLSLGISIDIKASVDEGNSCRELTKNLEYLKIPLIVFSANIEFWLLFLQRNIKLKLTVFCDCKEKLFKILFFEQLLSSKKFPHQLQHINISDFLCGL